MQIMQMLEVDSNEFYWTAGAVSTAGAVETALS